MAAVERLLEGARKELAKVRDMLGKSHCRERQQALLKSKQLEEEQIPSPQSLLDEQHSFSSYEEQLQGMLQPVASLDASQKKKSVHHKNPIKRKKKKK